MFTHNATISKRQVRLLLILQMLSTSLLILPRIAAFMVNQDGYLLPIIAIGFGAIYLWVITALTNRFKGETIVEFAPKIVTKPIGILICILFFVKFIVTVGLELRMFGEMISQILLDKTPLPVILLTMLFAVAYLIKSGIEATARMGEVVIYFVGLALFIILLLIVGKADYRQVMPFFQADAKGIIQGGYFVSFTFMPIEGLLLLAAFMEEPREARRSGITAILVIAALEVILILMTYAGIGLSESKRHIWPVIALMQNIQFPGSFIENQEILMMVCWVMSIYMNISCGFYFANLISSRLFHFKRENIGILPLIPVIYLVAIFPDSLISTYQGFVIFHGNFGIVFLLIVPLLLLIVASIRKVGMKE